MKLRLLPVVFALVVPLTACNGNSNSSSPAAVQSPNAASSPLAQSSPSSTAPSPATASPNPASSPSTAATVPGNWYSYSSSEGNYTAKFPAKPNEQKRAANSQQGQISGAEVRYVDNAKQRLYLTGHVNIPVPQGASKSSLNVDKALDGGRDSMANTVGAKIKSETKISQNGYPGREFIMILPNNMAAKARIFINPEKLKAYQAIIAAKDGKVDFPEANGFLDSLKINK
ncbi:MAG TPA: hypothetical protein V6D12_20465 [Candidatus Obscuribacterales bacterium]